MELKDLLTGFVGLAGLVTALGTWYNAVWTRRRALIAQAEFERRFKTDEEIRAQFRQHGDEELADETEGEMEGAKK